jgi:hypothetical protein
MSVTSMMELTAGLTARSFGAPPDVNRSASIRWRVMLKSCPSNASKTQPADAIASTSH